MLRSSDEIVEVEGFESIGSNGHVPRVIPVFGVSDGMDIFYVRVRDEFNETNEAAISRAREFAREMSNVIMNSQGSWRS